MKYSLSTLATETDILAAESFPSKHVYGEENPGTRSRSRSQRLRPDAFQVEGKDSNASNTSTPGFTTHHITDGQDIAAYKNLGVTPQ
jgi:hypothetical protein